jgi:hypothetical protein
MSSSHNLSEMSITELSYTVGLSKKKSRLLYYLIIICLHFYMHNWLAEVFPDVTFFRRILFLTNISFYSNLIYYIYVFIMHVPYGHKFKHHIFLTAYFKFCYGLSFVVFIMYWGMVISDPSLLVRDPTITILPLFLDLFLHGANFILNLIEHVFVFPKSDSKAIGILFYGLFSMGYAVLLQIVYKSHGISVYPFVNKFSLIEFSLFVGVATFMIYIGDCTYRLFLKKEKHHHVHAEKHTQ